jgi:cytochrome c biogenesis protein
LPHEYRSDLVIYENGKEVKTGSAVVNRPVTYGHLTFYQSSFGQAVSLRVKDASGKVVYDDSIPLGIYVSSANPDAPAGVLDLPEQGLRLSVIAPDNDPANRPDLDTLRLQSGQMFIQARSLGANAPATMPSAVVTQGDQARFGDVTVEFVRERQFTLLQVGSNPGIPIFVVAALLLIGGLAVTFYFPHRRIRGILTATPEGTRLHLAPLVKRDWSGRRDFERLVAHLAERIGVRPDLRLRDADGTDEPARGDGPVPLGA